MSLYVDDPGLPTIRYLTTDGLGTTNENLNGNYAVTTDFSYQVPIDQVFEVYQLAVKISDGELFGQTGYGGLGIGLTNGVQFLLSSHGNESALFNGLAVINNQGWFDLGPRVFLTTFTPADALASNVLTVLIDFVGDFGKPLILKGSARDKFIVRLNDDFSVLTSHVVSLRGTLYQQ